VPPAGFTRLFGGCRKLRCSGGDCIGTFRHLDDDIPQSGYHFSKSHSQLILLRIGHNRDSQIFAGDCGRSSAHTLQVIDQAIESLADHTDLILAQTHLIFFLVTRFTHKIANRKCPGHFRQHPQRNGNTARNYNSKYQSQQ